MGMEMGVEAGGERMGTYEIVIEVGRKTQEKGRCQRVTSNHSRGTRHPTEVVASCGEPELRNGRRGKMLERAEERRRSAKDFTRVVDTMWKTREIWAEE